MDDILKSVLSGRNLLLAGPGGVGKSHTIRYLAKSLDAVGKKVYITASTGVAALNLSQDGSDIKTTTVHAFAGCKTATLDIHPLINMVRTNNKAVKNWMKCEILIIDEISMIGGELFKKLDAIAKAIRENKKPFGGIQLILSGDFLQLSPVKDTWVFLTKEWENLILRPFVLEIPYRYDDTSFFELLQRIRIGDLTEQDYKILKSRVKAHEKVQEILKNITTDENVGEIIKPTILYSKRIDVDEYNQKELKKLPGEPIKFTAIDTTVYKKNVRLEDYKKMLDDDIPSILHFKVGAQVMLRVNLDLKLGLCNGSRGVVCDIIPDEALMVKFLNGQKVKIELHPRKFEDKKIIITRYQIPCILAYSCTIHKCQGSTLDYSIVSLDSSIFCPGQAYVALSRCRNISGLFISNFVSQSIKADQTAINYCNAIKKMCELENIKEKSLFESRYLNLGISFVIYKKNKIYDSLDQNIHCSVCLLREQISNIMIDDNRIVPLCQKCYDIGNVNATTFKNKCILKYLYVFSMTDTSDIAKYIIFLYCSLYK
jgi:ATP-dependent DNA helicase PIF1